MIAGLDGLLAGPLAGLAEIYTLDTSPDATTPSVWITGGPDSPGSRMLDSRARGITETARLVCSSSSAAGAAALARDVALILDGAKLGGRPLQVPLISDPLEDPTDPSDYCWSATVDVTRQTAR